MITWLHLNIKVAGMLFMLKTYQREYIKTICNIKTLMFYVSLYI